MQTCSVGKLCVPGGSPKGCSLSLSSVHGAFQGRILEMPFPTPKGLPDAGAEPRSSASLALACKFFITEPPGEPLKVNNTHVLLIEKNITATEFHSQ